jgi:DNA-binding SARP family transcriptional activator
MMTIVLLGSMRVSLDHVNGGKQLTLTPRVAEMLAYLALRRGRYFLRSELATALREHDDIHASEGSINTTLWRLRQVIEPTPAYRGSYIVGGRVVGLNGPEDVRVDVAEFEQCVSAGVLKSVDELTELDCVALRRGTELYFDEALRDFKSSWAIRERDRLRALYLDVTIRLMQQCARQHKYFDAIHYARIILGIEPLREDVHRDLMYYLFSSGQRPLALRHYEVCRAALRRELAVRPMPETIALYRDIANGQVEMFPLDNSKRGEPGRSS